MVKEVSLLKVQDSHCTTFTVKNSRLFVNNSYALKFRVVESKLNNTIVWLGQRKKYKCRRIQLKISEYN